VPFFRAKALLTPALYARGVRRVLVAAVVLALAALAARAGEAATSARVTCPVGSPPGVYLASWSPSGDRIAVAQSIGPNTSLPVIAADGASVVGGFEGPWDSPPLAIALSSSGRLALLKRTGEIDVEPPYGLSVQAAPRTDPSVVSELGGWSPDGTRIVYTRGSYDPAASTVRATMDVFDTRDGTTTSIGTGSNPSWSPDGAWIAFVDESGTATNGAPIRELDVEHPDGTGRRTVLRDAALSTPSWSPDGTHLLFLWEIDVAPHVETIALDGSDRRDIIDAFGPAFWTVSGIVADLPNPDYGPVVAIVDPATGRARPLTHVPSRQYGTAAVAVSPDGRKIVYSIASAEADQAFGMRVANVDGTGDRPLLDCLGTTAPDRIVGSPLADVVRADAGNDVVDVRSGGIDSVSCGPGRDTAYADRRDRVAADCERVIRRR